jgi:hypothetical protein
MLKLILFCLVLLFAGRVQADVVKMDGHLEPRQVSVHEKMTVLISAKVATDPKRVPKKVRLLRLQWAGNEREISKMWDDGTHGDVTASDGVYACTLKLKEKIVGLISFRIEAFYDAPPTPIYSQPIFLEVVGGVK